MAYQLFLGYLMPKPFSVKNSSGTIYQPLRSGRIWHKVNFLSGV